VILFLERKVNRIGSYLVGYILQARLAVLAQPLCTMRRQPYAT